MSAGAHPRVIDASFEEARERRGADRRAPRPRRFDPLFAATLVNHVAPAERAYMRGYDGGRIVRAGVVVDLSA
jgi:hypothetical protein